MLPPVVACPEIGQNLSVGKVAMDCRRLHRERLNGVMDRKIGALFNLK